MSNKISLTVDKTAIFNALINIKDVINNRNTIAILAMVKLDAEEGRLIITGTDMDISVSETVKAEVKETGSLTINAKVLYEIVKKASEETIKFKGDADTGKVSITCGKSRFSAHCLHGDEFPFIERGDMDCEVDIKSADLLNLLKKTSFCASEDEMKHNMNGINLHIKAGKLVADATDGHRMARIISQGEVTCKFEPIIIPMKTVNIIVKIIAKPSNNFKFLVSKSKIYIVYNDTAIVSKLVDGNFPKCDDALALQVGKSNSLSVNREWFLRAVDRVALAASELHHTMRLFIDQGQLTLFSMSEEKGIAEEDLEVESDFYKYEICYNSKYLSQALSNMACSNVVFTIWGEKLPARLYNPENENELYLMSPMKG